MGTCSTKQKAGEKTTETLNHDFAPLQNTQKESVSLNRNHEEAVARQSAEDHANLLSQPVPKLPQKLSEVPINVVVRQTIGDTNDKQFDYVEHLVKGMFVNGRIGKQLVTDSTTPVFKVYAEGQSIHSTETDGPIQKSIGFSDKLKQLAAAKI